MAAILQLKRGVSTPTLLESEPFFNTVEDRLEIGEGSRVIVISKMNEVNKGSFQVDGNTSLTGSLNVSSLSTLSTVNVSTSLNVTAPLTVTGNSQLTGLVTINGDTSVTGLSTFTGDMSIVGDVTNSGSIETLGALIDTQEDTEFLALGTFMNMDFDQFNLVGDMIIDGLIDLDGTLTTTGLQVDVAAGNTFAASGSELHFDFDEFDFEGNFKVDGTSEFTGSVSVSGLGDLLQYSSSVSTLLDQLDDNINNVSSSLDESKLNISDYEIDSGSFDTRIEEAGIFKQTGSFYATTNDLEVTGSIRNSGSIETLGMGVDTQEDTEFWVSGSDIQFDFDTFAFDGTAIFSGSFSVEGIGELTTYSASVYEHTSDTTIHFTQGEIEITESQISDLDKYTQSEVDSLIAASSGIFSETGSFYATTNDIQITGSFDVGGETELSGSLGVGITPSGIYGRIDASDDIVAFSTSDKRLKTDIQSIKDSTVKVKQIRGVTFTWDPETKDIHGYSGTDIGVIAQEIESVLPELVTTRDNGYKAVKYDKIVALLIEAVKEQSEEITKLHKRIDELSK